MSDDLRSLEQKALEATRGGDFKLAAELWCRILVVQDNWEHGYAHYNLANCYVRLGRLDDAEAEYGKAVLVEPNDAWFFEALEGLKAARKQGLI